LIGLFGLKEINEGKFELDDQNDSKKPFLMPLSLILINGVLHGLSLDGAASLAPSLALGSWSAALLFLGAYSLGSAAVMSVGAGAISALSNRWVSGRTLLGAREGGQSELGAPVKLARYSSYLAILVGTYWILSTGLKH
jgi:hypothetical protein